MNASVQADFEGLKPKGARHEPHSIQPRVPAQAPAQDIGYTSYQLALCEIARLVKENFGRMPQGAWADAVLAVRDAYERSSPEKTKEKS